ncbi:MAG: hypothetical protein KAT11_01995 [Phycisphaerae bacterium]|nr:hypothetical protein [Phycisphaerae bacterium]
MPTAVEREAQAIKSEAKKILLIVVIISVVIYAFSGTAQVGEEQTGLVIRFGTIAKTLKGRKGLYLGYPWPIDKVVRIPTGVSHDLDVKNFNLDPKFISEQKTKLYKNNRFRQLSDAARSALANPYLVTADLNVLHLELAVVYNITDPEAYYQAAGQFEDVRQTNVQNIARKVVANALIQTVSQMEVMQVLAEGQTLIKARVQEISQKQFDQLKLGITIRGADAIRITNSRVPSSLQEVFSRVTTAMQTRADLINLAKVERRRILDKAEADVATIRTEAYTYAEATVKQAYGDAQRYTELINEYHDKGEVVRDRLRNEKLAEVAPYFKAPIIHAMTDTDGKQRLVITIPGKPE